MVISNTNEILQNRDAPSSLTPDINDNFTNQMDILLEKFGIDKAALPENELENIMQRFKENPDIYYVSIDSKLAALDKNMQVEISRKSTSEKLKLFNNWLIEAQNKYKTTSLNNNSEAVDLGNQDIQSQVDEELENQTKKVEQEFKNRIIRRVSVSDTSNLSWFQKIENSVKAFFGGVVFNTAKDMVTSNHASVGSHYTEGPSIGQSIKYAVVGFISTKLGLGDLANIGKKYKETIDSVKDAYQSGKDKFNDATDSVVDFFVDEENEEDNENDEDSNITTSNEEDSDNSDVDNNNEDSSVNNGSNNQSIESDDSDDNEEEIISDSEEVEASELREKLPTLSREQRSWQTIRLIKSVADVRINPGRDNQDYSVVFKEHSDKTYEEFIGLESDHDITEVLQYWFKTENFQTLAGYAFYTDIFKSLLKPDGINYSPVLLELYSIEKLDSWYKMGNGSEQIDWKNKFTIEEIGIINSLSIPFFTNGLFKSSPEVTGEISDITGIDASQLNQIKNKNFSDSLITTFVGTLGDNWGGREKLKKEYDQEIIDSGETEDDKIMLKNIVDFKNKIIPSLFENKRLGLSKDQQDTIDEQINYKYILNLYSITGGNTDLDSMNPISIFVLQAGIYDILTNGDGTDAGKFFRDIMSSLLPNFGAGTIEKREQEVIKIINIKVRNKYLNSKARKLMYGAGITGTEGNIGTLAWVTTSIIALYVSEKFLEYGHGWFEKRSIIKALSRGFGTSLRVAGGLLLAGSVAKIYLENNNAHKDFEKAIESIDQNGDYNMMYNFEKKIRDSITVKKFKDKRGEIHTFTSISYEGDPTYFIVDGKTRMLGRVDNTIKENVAEEGIVDGALETIENSGLQMIEEGKYVVIENVKYDLSKTYIEGNILQIPSEDGNKLPFGIDLDKLIIKYANTENKTDQINLGEEGIYSINYKPILDGDAGTSLVLVETGDMNSDM